MRPPRAKKDGSVSSTSFDSIELFSGPDNGGSTGTCLTRAALGALARARINATGFAGFLVSIEQANVLAGKSPWVSDEAR
jgi:hypothetical protein